MAINLGCASKPVLKNGKYKHIVHVHVFTVHACTVSVLENSRFPWNIDSKIGGFTGILVGIPEHLELNTLGIFHQIFHGI